MADRGVRSNEEVHILHPEKSHCIDFSQRTNCAGLKVMNGITVITIASKKAAIIGCIPSWDCYTDRNSGAPQMSYKTIALRRTMETLALLETPEYKPLFERDNTTYAVVISGIAE